MPGISLLSIPVPRLSRAARYTTASSILSTDLRDETSLQNRPSASGNVAQEEGDLLIAASVIFNLVLDSRETFELFRVF